MLSNHCYQNVVSLSLSDEAETGSGGDRPVRNSLTERNGKGGGKVPLLLFFYSGRLCLKKRMASIEAKRNITTIINTKKGQHISGQDNSAVEKVLSRKKSTTRHRSGQ
jgi:hypothetical protein